MPPLTRSMSPADGNTATHSIPSQHSAAKPQPAAPCTMLRLATSCDSPASPRRLPNNPHFDCLHVPCPHIMPTRCTSKQYHQACCGARHATTHPQRISCRWQQPHPHTITTQSKQPAEHSGICRTMHHAAPGYQHAATAVRTQTSTPSTFLDFTSPPVMHTADPVPVEQLQAWHITAHAAVLTLHAACSCKTSTSTAHLPSANHTSLHTSALLLHHARTWCINVSADHTLNYPAQTPRCVRS
jgi:hypothetical protein